MIPGIDILLGRHRDWLEGQILAAIVHPASRTADGIWTPDRLHQDPDIQLAALMGPEHGIEGSGAAGEELAHGRHLRLDYPVWSLYGDSRKPTDSMLAKIDAVLFDLQDLSVRCYTYASTLHGVMQACAAAGKTLIIADRPTPLMQVVDGPMLDPAFQSFVADIPTPLVYGMTPGELAHFLHRMEYPELDLRIAPCGNLSRETFELDDFADWIPPSPAIRSTDSACCYPSTVFIEGIPAIDAARQSRRAFQVLGAPWMNAEALTLHLQARQIPGVEFAPIAYPGESGPYAGELLQGIQIQITHLETYRPAAVMVHILEVLSAIHGPDTIWKSAEIRPDWFDQLMGTSKVRRQLELGTSSSELVNSWEIDRDAFLTKRKPSLFY